MNKRIIRIIIYIFVTLLVYLIPRALVERGSLCIYYNLIHVLCPTCGATRALWNFARLDFISAYNFNPLLTLTLYPFLSFLVINDVYCFLKEKVLQKYTASYYEYLISLCFGGKK